MVLLNIYGKIEPVVICEKLGIGLSNLDDDWALGMVEYMTEEMLLRAHDLKIYANRDFDAKIRQYNPTDIVLKANWNSDIITDDTEALNIISKNLIQLNVLNFDSSLLQLKNKFIDSPTCEVQYPVKFISFCHIISKSEKIKPFCKYGLPFITYNSNDMDRRPSVLNYASSMVESEENVNLYLNNHINSLSYVGNMIDEFLDDEDDFWIFDYIVNALHDTPQHTAYYIFKMMSLIEMLIINPIGDGKSQGELERKLPRFLIEDISADWDKVSLTEIVRKLRNKIAHGDFKAFQKLLRDYRNKFMKNFEYDEFEYSIESWTILSICLTLEHALGQILFELFSKKNEFYKFRRS